MKITYRVKGHKQFTTKQFNSICEFYSGIKYCYRKLLGKNVTSKDFHFICCH